MLGFCLNLSWYRHWSDSSHRGSAHCFILRYKEESQTGGQATQQLAQYAVYVQLSKL